MKKYILTFVIAFLLFGCQSIDPPFKKESKSNDAKLEESGAYYLDDGPEENPPENLDEIPNAKPKYEALSKWASRPYVAFDKKYTPMTKIIPFKEEGYASWYGKRYHGKKTSIGETYDMYQMTGAHKILPLPCYIKVTNLKNQRSVIIRVNDRGPFVDDRIVDLSYAAAQRLVKIEMINPSLAKKNVEQTDKASSVDSSIKYFYIQAGAFSNKNNASYLINRLSKIKFRNSLNIKTLSKDSLYLVTIGPYDTKKIAEQALQDISQKIQLNSFIISK